MNIEEEGQFVQMTDKIVQLTLTPNCSLHWLTLRVQYRVRQKTSHLKCFAIFSATD